MPVADLNEFISLGNDLQLAGICEKGKECENNEYLKPEPIQANEHFNDSQKGEMLELEDQDEEEDAESLEKHLNLIHSGSDCTNTSNKALFKVSEQAIKPRKDNSPVWLCAVKLSNDMSQCKICKKNIPTLGGSTSNIAGHLSRQHSDVKEVMEVQRMLLEKKKMRDCKNKNL